MHEELYEGIYIKDGSVVLPFNSSYLISLPHVDLQHSPVLYLFMGIILLVLEEEMALYFAGFRRIIFIFISPDVRAGINV